MFIFRFAYHNSPAMLYYTIVVVCGRTNQDVRMISETLTLLIYPLIQRILNLVTDGQNNPYSSYQNDNILKHLQGSSTLVPF